MTIKVKDTDYNVKFGYNSFCDSDLLDRTMEAMTIVGELEKGGQGNNGVQTIQKMFGLVRDLLFEGFKKCNPVADKDAVGNILDDYLDEDRENHGLINIFAMLSKELLEEGFFGDLLNKSVKAVTSAKNGKVKKN